MRQIELLFNFLVIEIGYYFYKLIVFSKLLISDLKFKYFSNVFIK